MSKHNDSSEGKTMPSRTRAADRVKNANEQWAGWVRTPYWDEAVEEAFQDRVASGELPDPWPLVLRLVEDGYSVSLRRHADGQYVATISDKSRSDAGKSSLLSGWAEDLHESLLVLDYKHSVMLDRDWDNEPEQRPRIRR